MTNEELVIRIKNGIDVAKNMEQLYMQTKGFIYKMAKRYSAYAEIEDLAQEGYFGLNDAVEHYDAEAGASFIHYASYWIKVHMIRYMEKGGNTIRFSAGMRERMLKYINLSEQFEKAYNRKPSDEEMGWIMHLPTEKVEEIKRSLEMRNLVSIDRPVSDESDMMLYEVLESNEHLEEDVIERLDREAVKTSLWECVDSLEGEQPDIIRLVYEHGMNRKQAGDKLGIKSSRVRTEEKKALRALRYGSNARRLRPYYDEYIAAKAYDSGNEWDSITERLALKLTNI